MSNLRIYRPNNGKRYEFAYDLITRTLFVTFVDPATNKRIYRYEDISPGIVSSILFSDSIGSAIELLLKKRDVVFNELRGDDLLNYLKRISD